MDTLIEIYQRLLREMVPSYRRKFYDDFKMDSRFVGVVGARGVGKTTFLVNYLRDHCPNSPQALYISADNLYFVEHTLFETVDRFVKEFNGQILCIDEVHKYKNWDIELKNIYDSFPKISIIFSGSSSIDLVRGKADLSRRPVLKTMYGFSFREFLEIKENKSYPVLTLNDLIDNHYKYAQKIMSTPKLPGFLKEYLKLGYYPTFLELKSYEAYKNTLQNIVDKIIYEDISSFYSLNTSNLDTLKKIVYFFATSQPGSVNVNRLAQNLKKDNTTIAEYIQMLKDTGLLRFLLKNKQGHALVRDAEKIFLENTNLLYTMNEEVGQEPFIGVMREMFVIGSLQNSGYHVFSSEKADIESQGYTFEIGGKSKTSAFIQTSKKAYIVKDDILIGDRKNIPLYLFGFLS
ncbi:MAG: AAA family ATPase [Candidatus Levybacteria bacterium]|nr:AAA family ATPase [Candidatus Levybacteria bacterium]